jgi:multidrug transporter EmrE-like cation transporter
MKELRVLAERWRIHYNTVRPHSSLGYRPPAPQACQDTNNPGHGVTIQAAALTIELVQKIWQAICRYRNAKLSDGCSRAIPSVFMVLLYGVSFFPTAMALRRLDVGMAYAVWSAVATTLITLIGMVLFKEQISIAKWPRSE